MLDGRDSPVDRERRARHLLEAGTPEEALELLLVSARFRYEMAEVIRSERLLEDFDSAAAMLGIDEDDLRVARCRVQQIVNARARGQLSFGFKLASEIEQRARSRGWTELLADILLEQACFRQDQFDEAPKARVLLREAAALFSDLGLTERVGKAWLNLGFSYAYSRNVDKATHCFETALEYARQIEDHMLMAFCLEGLSTAACVVRRLKDAEKLGHEGLESARIGEAERSEGRILLLLGDIARAGGNPAHAEVLYRESFSILERLGAGLKDIAELHVACALVEQGAYEAAAARPMLMHCLSRFEAEKRPHFLLTARRALLICAARAEDWSEWREHFDAAMAIRAGTDYVDMCIPPLSERAADLALEAGRETEAREALEVAVSEWEEMGWPLETAAARARLKELYDPLGDTRG